MQETQGDLGNFLAVNNLEHLTETFAKNDLTDLSLLGYMTNEQYDSLLEIGFRGSGAWQACLTWMTTNFTAAATEGHIKESTYLLVLLENTTKLRGLMVDVDDMYAGRCPIVYIHFVQLLVDCYIIIAPFALVVTSGYWAILSVAILTLFPSPVRRLDTPFSSSKFGMATSSVRV